MRHAALVLFIAALTLICRSIIVHLFDIDLPGKYWLRDFLGNWTVALLFYLLIRSLKKTMLLAGIVITLFQLSNALKLVILGTPASPDDFLNIQNLFFLTEGWRRWLMYLTVALPFLLAIAFIPWRRSSTWLVIAGLTISSLTLAYNGEPTRIYLDTRFGNSVWNQPANYKSRGLALHLAQETIRTIAKTGKTPDKEAVEQALQGSANHNSSPLKLESSLQTLIDPASAYAQRRDHRNVHVFVLESFFDPMSLGSDWVPEDPFPESFRQLWAEAGNSHAMSPVFGGYTANAEFEVLCGFPVTRNAVFFEGWLRKRVPCLPDLLSKNGYTTLASHPNVPGFWNRTHAYHLIGFDHYLSKEHFDLQESVGGLLLDGSLYDQIFERLDNDEFASPLYNYMLTYHGHLPYPGSEKYPDQIKAGKESVLLHGYLNQLWYKSRDLMKGIAHVRSNDPDALILIFGDHLPFLGSNYGVYTEAWQLPEQRDQFTGRQLEMLTSTPLIVIDGQRGPLPLGKVPLYRLPSILMSLLGMENEPTIFNMSLNPDEHWIRPLYGMHINTHGSKTHACTEVETQADSCVKTSAWLKRTETLIRDIFTGNQHSFDQLSQ